MIHTDTDVLDEVSINTISTDLYTLIVWNDSVNTFQNIIMTLIEVCKHTTEQAEQCAMIIHHTGKCSVKNGSDYDEMLVMYEKIKSRGIIVTLEIK